MVISMSNKRQEISAQLEVLRAKYLETLPEYMAVLKESMRELRANTLSDDSWQELRRAAHKLSGSGGSFGFVDISRAAEKLEHKIDNLEKSEDDIGVMSALAILIDILQTAGEKQEEPKKEEQKPQIAPAATAPKLKKRSKILIAEDDAVVAQLLRSLMENEIDIEIIEDGNEVLSAAKTLLPDLILLDNDLPGLTGLEIVSELQESEATRAIPVIMLTGNGDPQNVMRAVTAGAKDYFTKPFEPISFINHIRSLLARKDYAVLLVDDDAAIRALLLHRFEAFGMRCIEAADGIEALEKAKSETPSLIILDRMMPGLVGGAVLHELKSSEMLRSVPVIMLTAQNSAGDAHDWLKRGAVDFIKKPFDPDEVVLRALRVLQIEDVA